MVCLFTGLLSISFKLVVNSLSTAFPMYLNCHSYFSFKYGILSPEQLLEDASRLGHQRIALTDINNTSGILDFARLSGKHGIQPVVGIDFRNGNRQLFVGIARNGNGFLELNDYLSGFLHTKEKIPETAPVFRNAFVIYPFPQEIRRLDTHEFIGIRLSDLNRLAFSPWREKMDKLVLLQPVTFRDKKDFNAHRLLRAMDHNIVLSKLPVYEQARPDEIMLEARQVQKLLESMPSLISNTERLVESCSIDFDFGKNKNKKTFSGSVQGDKDRIRRLCDENLSYRYPEINDVIRNRVEKEIAVITELGFASYFLINHEIISYARYKNYFYVGRGSGANSMVAYLLRITDVDPVDLDLYFERFINPYRTSPPDFDLDFSWKDRDDVIRHIFEVNDPAHTAQLATYSTFQDHAVLRELGKVFGLPKSEIDALLENGKHPSTPDHISRLIDTYARHLYNFPSHLSIHAGGILISEEPIHRYSATTIPPKGFPLVQFSMLEAEDVGLYKFDILSQRGLGHIRDTVDIVRENHGTEIDIHDVKKFKQDVRVKQRLKEARCMGCFYIESPAMRMLLKKLEVDHYLGLVAASSIIRPGVSSSGMMKEYILRFRGMKPSYETPKAIYEILQDTYGVMVYQEDVIKVAHYFAGLTLGEADMLRRGMSGKYRGRAEFEKVREKFFSNCMERKYPDAMVKEVWRQIESFAGYAFSKGHSASYAVESYQSLYVKTYYPLEHMTAVINNFGGFYRTEFYIHEARMNGARVEAPDINESEYLTRITGKTIFLGFILVAGLEQKTAETLLSARKSEGPFTSLENLMKRISISVEQLRILIRVGALRFTGRTKKQLLWDIYAVLGPEKKSVAGKELFEVSAKPYQLPSLRHTFMDDAYDQLELLGFPLCSPFSMLKPGQVAEPVRRAADLATYHKREITITGYLVTVKYTRTKYRETMMFGTFLDSEGMFFDTTHFPKVTEAFPFRGRGCYRIRGRVAEEFGFYSLDVIEMHRLEYRQRYDE